MITRVKGTQDFLDLTLFNFILNTTKQHLQTYHFQEIATPILEHTELFVRSLGTETDVVSKEMYILPSSSEEKESICLRPEATASTMRAFLNNHVQTTPWKVFCWGPMFRHERPQKGRFRQFHQISMEVIGTNSIATDVLFITMLDRLFTHGFKLDTYGLLINFMGCPDDRHHFKKILHAFLEKNVSALCENCIQRKERNILRIFDCKNSTCQQLYMQAPAITDYLCKECTQEWQSLQQLLQQLSVSYSVAPTLVRGLDYYGKTVFEFVSVELGAQNTFCGGGRYNNLATEIGATTDYPSIGAAMGIERLLMMLEPLKEKLTLQQPPRLHAVIPYSEEQVSLCLQITDMLSAHNLCAELMVEQESMKSKMRHANKLGAKYCIIVGPEEQAAGTVSLKDMVNGTEHKVAQRDLIKMLS